MRINKQKLANSSKAFAFYFWNRMKGVEYGKAVLNDTKVRIVPTKELEKFIADIEQYGFPRNGAIQGMSSEKANELLRRIKPIISTDKKIITSGNLNYHALVDRFQLIDPMKREQKLFVMTKAPNPTRDFLRYIWQSLKLG